MSTNGNGSTKLVWFLLSVSLAVLFAVSGAWATNQVSMDAELLRRISALERQYERIDQKLDLLLEDRGKRR